MISLVDLPITEVGVMTTAMPPKPSGRIFEQVKAEGRKALDNGPRGS